MWMERCDKMNERGFEQTIKWRVPATAAKWKGKAEGVMSVADPKGDKPPMIDIRTRKTQEHPKGEGFTREGVRLTLEDATTLSKALQHTLQALEGFDGMP